MTVSIRSGQYGVLVLLVLGGAVGVACITRAGRDSSSTTQRSVEATDRTEQALDNASTEGPVGELEPVTQRSGQEQDQVGQPQNDGDESEGYQVVHETSYQVVHEYHSTKPTRVHQWSIQVPAYRTGDALAATLRRAAIDAHAKHSDGSVNILAFPPGADPEGFGHVGQAFYAPSEGSPGMEFKFVEVDIKPAREGPRGAQAAGPASIGKQVQRPVERPNLTHERPGIGNIAYTRTGPVFVAASREAYKRLDDLALARDETGIQELVLLGLVWTAPAYQKCRVIKVHGFLDLYCEVRLLDGPHSGSTGFTSLEVLRTARE